MRKDLSKMVRFIYHEMLMTWREAYQWLTPLIFFIIVASLFSLTLGPRSELLHQSAPGIIWVAVILAILLSIGNLFQNDIQEGFLDLMLISSLPLSGLVLAKIISHWLTHCFPLILMSPIVGLLLNLSPAEEFALFFSLLLGTPVLSLLGAIGAALIVGIRGHGLLLPILIMPLYIPVLIFGTSAIMAANMHQNTSGYFAILGALSLFSLAFAPVMAGLALRIGVNQ